MRHWPMYRKCQNNSQCYFSISLMGFVLDGDVVENRFSLPIDRALHAPFYLYCKSIRIKAPFLGSSAGNCSLSSYWHVRIFIFIDPNNPIARSRPCVMVSTWHTHNPVHQRLKPVRLNKRMPLFSRWGWLNGPNHVDTRTLNFNQILRVIWQYS